MIRSLRRSHARIWWMGPFLIVGVILSGTRWRGDIPTPALPIALLEHVQAPVEALPDLARLVDTKWSKLSIEAHVYADASGARWVELRPLTDPLVPDLLVYALDGEPAGEGPPSTALLLGTLAGTQPRRFRWPAGENRPEIVIGLYSLAHQRWVDSTPVAFGATP